MTISFQWILRRFRVAIVPMLFVALTAQAAVPVMHAVAPLQTMPGQVHVGQEDARHGHMRHAAHQWSAIDNPATPAHSHRGIGDDQFMECDTMVCCFGEPCAEDLLLADRPIAYVLRLQSEITIPFSVDGTAFERPPRRT